MKKKGKYGGHYYNYRFNKDNKAETFWAGEKGNFMVSKFEVYKIN